MLFPLPLISLSLRPPPPPSQVAAPEWSGDAAAPRLRWCRPGALLLPARALPAAMQQPGGWGGRGQCQHARGAPHDPGALLPPPQETGRHLQFRRGVSRGLPEDWTFSQLKKFAVVRVDVLGEYAMNSELQTFNPLVLVNFAFVILTGPRKP